MAERIKQTLNKPVWQGGRTLHIGELAVFIIALLILWWQKIAPLKNMWFWLAMLMILVAMIIW